MPNTRTSDLRTHLDRTLDHVSTSAELDELLVSGRRLRVKWGVDCTAPDLHLGHAVNLWLLRRLQEAGYTVILLLGDATTGIGDPTGRDRTRPVIPPEEIERNAAAFLEQASAVLHTEPGLLEVRRNSEWYDAMSAPEFLGLLSEVTHAQLMARDMFRRRIAESRDIVMHELCYPVLQAYDSVALSADIALAGSDQLFNEMLARPFQQRRGQRPQVVMTTRITPGIDGGEKQSKSIGNTIALADSPRDKFGKAMSIPDRLIPEYLEVYTELPIERAAAVRDLLATDAPDARGIALRDAKLDLAEAIVARYHGAESGAAERAWFLRVFAGGGDPGAVPTLELPSAALTVLELIRRARPELSGSESRRLITQGGVRLDDAVLGDPQLSLTPTSGALLRIGRRHWFRLHPRRSESR